MIFLSFWNSYIYYWDFLCLNCNKNFKDKKFGSTENEMSNYQKKKKCEFKACGAGKLNTFRAYIHI